MRDLDKEVASMVVTIEGTCDECGGWLDGHTSVAGDGFTIGPCTCGNWKKEAERLFEPEVVPMDNLPVTEESVRPIFKTAGEPLAVLSARLSDLKARPKDSNGDLTRMTIELMADWQSDAKAILAAAADSEPAKQVNNAFRVHRFLSGMWHRMIDPVEADYAWVGKTIGEWKQKKIREMAAEKRRREDAARQQQQADRKADVVALKSAGHVEEAKELAAAPLPPIVIPDAKADMPVKSASVRTVYKFDKIVDAKLLAQYFVEHPDDLIALMEPKLGEWKRRATAAEGKWAVAGVTFAADVETRNTSRGT